MNNLRHSFPGQERDEAVFVFIRPYFLAFLPTALAFITVIAISFAVQAAAAAGFGFADPYYNNLLIIFMSLFQLLALIVFFVALFDYYFDILIVTDRRLVDIDHEQLFFRQISELALEDVEDVTSIVKGFFQTTFHYGSVRIQTAGNRENFLVENIRFPREITTLILDLSSQSKQNIQGKDRSPESSVIGIINNRPIRSWQDLARQGAASSHDPRNPATSPSPSTHTPPPAPHTPSSPTSHTGSHLHPPPATPPTGNHPHSPTGSHPHDHT
jgi:hypothetical protein